MDDPLKKTLLVVRGTAASIRMAQLSGFVEVLAKGKETFSGFVWRKLFSLSRVGVPSKNLSTLYEYSIWLRTRFVRFITKINCSTMEIKLLFLIVGSCFAFALRFVAKQRESRATGILSSFLLLVCRAVRLLSFRQIKAENQRNN